MRRGLADRRVVPDLARGGRAGHPASGRVLRHPACVVAGDTSGWPSWFLVVADGSTPALRILVPAVCAALLVVLLRRPAARWGPELRGWALLYPLYLLGATTPTTSIFRYSMLSVVPWWPFPEVGDAIRSRRDRWALVLLVSMLGLAAQVAWMRWFFVVGPHALERP